MECLTVGEGSKLFERSEFLDPPHENAERGKPQAKVVGGLSLHRFFGRQSNDEGSCIRWGKHWGPS